MSKDNGGPAFPHNHSTHASTCPGMTLRDYFASKAMQGLMADSEVTGTPDRFAKFSYEMADAMLKAREE